MGVVSLSVATATAASIQFQSQHQSPPPLLLLRVRGVFPATTRGGGGAFSISTTRTQICFPKRRHLFFSVKSVESSSTVDELRDSRVVPSNVLAKQKKEAKAVLTMFLRKQIGLNNAAAAETISKSDPFIDHLVARLHFIHKTRYLLGREFTTLEIRDALIPYLEDLCEEHEDCLDDVVENFRNPSEDEREDHRDSSNEVVEKFPNPSGEEREQHISAASRTKLPLHSKKLKAVARMTEIGSDGQLPSVTLYLMDIGLDLDQIKQMARKVPSITYPGWGSKIKPLVGFLLDIGVPPSNIPKILYKLPQLCDLSLSENIIPSMAYLETLGLDKSKWAQVIHQCPYLLTYSRQKVQPTVDYLCELGVSRDRIGRVLTRFPKIINYSVDDNLRLKAKYFQSMGVNFTSLLSGYPEIFRRSIEFKFKPVTEFFLDIGYSIDEIGTMASRFGSIYSMSLTKNLIPKWDFFLTMDYPRSELVKFTQYFGYSLEGRIKPRYAQMKECGVKLCLSQLLTLSDSDFLEALNRKKMKKMLDARHDSMKVASDKDLEPGRLNT